MPSFVLQTALAANQTIPNILAGSAFEFAPRDQKVAVAIVQDQTQMAAGAAVDATVQFGSDVQLEGGVLMGEAVQNAGPRIPENVVVDDVAAAGDRLVIRVAEVGSQATVVRTVVRILPL